MNKIYKSILSVSAAAVVLGASLAPAAVFAWGDSAGGRPSYTIAQINEGKLGNTITFNSISDSKIGDEKNFVGARLASSTGTFNADSITVKTGETYTIRLYVHNNNPNGLSAIAENVTASFSVPTTVATSHTIVGYLNSSNATPTRYWDEVKLTASENFYLEYVEGSAEYTNAKMGTVKLSNNIVTTGGVLLGYDSLNGRIPGCYTYDGVVTIKVKVNAAAAAKVEKTVRIKGSGANFTEAVTAKVGDLVEYQIMYQNLLNETVSNVMIRDVLPNNVEYVQNSTYLYNASHQSGVLLKDNTLTTTGINIGGYAANGNAYIRFTGKVVNKSLVCGSNQLVNWASATISSSTLKNAVYKDDASVMVTRTCENPTPPCGSNCTTPDDPKPQDDDPKPEDNTKDNPSSLPKTGPESIAMGAVGAGSVVTALGYFIKSRKKF